MATFPGDRPPLDADGLTAADVALLRPPQALWGYHLQATEETLAVIARSLTAREAEIASLRQELALLRGGQPIQASRWDGQVGQTGQWDGQAGGSLFPWSAAPGPGHDD